MSSHSSTAPAPSPGRNRPRLSDRLPSWMTNFGVQIILGLVAGVVLGFAAAAMGGDAEESPNWLMVTLDTIGTSYVSLLKAAVVPLIVTAVIASIANLNQVTNAARLAWKTLLWFAITALIAVVIGIGLGVVFQPGANTGLSTPESYDGSQGSWLGFITSIVPANFLGLSVSSKVAESGDVSSSVSFNVLQVLVVSGAIGIAALKIGEAAEPFLRFIRSALAVIQKVLWWIIRLAPLGTLGLIGSAIYTYGWTTMGSLAKFVILLYVGLAIVGFVVYPILARLNGLSIKQFFTGVWPAAQLGFVSRSSMGTMPVTQRVAERNFGVPPAYASFAVPFGATTKMDGCAAVYPALAAIFVAQFYGVDLQITHYLLIVLVSVLGSAATAGTTGATVMLTLTLSTLGLPLDGVGLLLAIDPIIDMGRTALNVSGQALIPAIISKQEGILDQGLYNAKRSSDWFESDQTAAEYAEAQPTDAERTTADGGGEGRARTDALSAAGGSAGEADRAAPGPRGA
ncbi:dicarboxylate/amino acid:cation symporter [Rothia sp. AR01]|uniref:Dicarboxylate/amino acid:cation symporter n=1 Tax=Rothia santali TaxID=2949643 RepID=A0A9X2HHU5_9MICC|nr:dicarboxylate/amino acid:cation symporter [Rothia santali]MCP3426842.1 dicarboxylate/amino acid:cation symporter [Rothia santali]